MEMTHGLSNSESEHNEEECSDSDRKEPDVEQDSELQNLKGDHGFNIEEGFEEDFSVGPLSANDLSLGDEEEVWLLRCPADIDPSQLYNKSFPVKGGPVMTIENEGGSTVFETVTHVEHRDPFVCLLPCKESKGLKTVVIQPAGMIDIREAIEIPELPDISSIKSRESVLLPDNLKVRHPLYGCEWKDKVKKKRKRHYDTLLDENISQNKMIDIPAKKKRKKSESSETECKTELISVSPISSYCNQRPLKRKKYENTENISIMCDMPTVEERSNVQVANFHSHINDKQETPRKKKKNKNKETETPKNKVYISEKEETGIAETDFCSFANKQKERHRKKKKKEGMNVKAEASVSEECSSEQEETQIEERDFSYVVNKQEEKPKKKKKKRDKNLEVEATENEVYNIKQEETDGGESDFSFLVSHQEERPRKKKKKKKDKYMEVETSVSKVYKSEPEETEGHERDFSEQEERFRRKKKKYKNMETEISFSDVHSSEEQKMN